jgi:cytochrome c-type biogenesis protein CcmH/NrfG
MGSRRNLTTPVAVLVLLGLALAVATGGDLGALLTLVVLASPVVGLVLLVRQMRFGVAAQRAAREMAEEGSLQYRELLERQPNGRVSSEVAARELTRRRGDVERSPEDWRAWFRLAAAWGDAGDGRRARAAMREAVRLRAAQQQHAPGPDPA